MGHNISPRAHREEDRFLEGDQVQYSNREAKQLAMCWASRTLSQIVCSEVFYLPQFSMDGVASKFESLTRWYQTSDTRSEKLPFIFEWIFFKIEMGGVFTSWVTEEMMDLVQKCGRLRKMGAVVGVGMAESRGGECLCPRPGMGCCPVMPGWSAFHRPQRCVSP